MSDLRAIPGVGKSMEHRLQDLGVRCLADLKGKDPETLYWEDCVRHGGNVDRCVLYVYRLAVYFAETESPEPEKLRWWNWKDGKDGNT